MAPEAGKAGINILRHGGNAVDAAVAMAFTLAVVHPQAGNIGGGGFLLIRNSNGTIEALDFREKAPLLADKDMYLDAKGRVIEGKSLIGPLAAGVPGTVAGFYELHRKYGKLPWKECLSPAIALAENGFAVSALLHRNLKNYREKFAPFPSSLKAFYPDGEIPGEGSLLRQPDLAKTLRQIAEKGSDGFYKGWIADSIVAFMKSSGGIISHEDLESYKPVWRSPRDFDFNGYRIHIMPLPGSGGIAIEQIIKMAEPFLSRKKYRKNGPEYIHLLAEAEKRAFADRNFYLADPDMVKVPVSVLTGEEYLRKRFPAIPVKATPAEEISHGKITGFEHEETTHFSVADISGIAVTCTYTLNGNFGSKAVVSGTGMLLNNEMDDFTVKPGVPNMFGLVMGTANVIEPGKRMLSSMSPAIVTKNDSLFLLTGSPGGSTIITTVLQSILNACYFKDSISENVKSLRFHHQWLPDILTMEKPFSDDKNLLEQLHKLGYKTVFRKRIGDVHAIEVKEGRFYPFSDSRLHGAAYAF